MDFIAILTCLRGLAWLPRSHVTSAHLMSWRLVTGPVGGIVVRQLHNGLWFIYCYSYFVFLKIVWRRYCLSWLMDNWEYYPSAAHMVFNIWPNFVSRSRGQKGQHPVQIWNPLAISSPETLISSQIQIGPCLGGGVQMSRVCLSVWFSVNFHTSTEINCFHLALPGEHI
jgi:hypothetical protein